MYQCGGEDWSKITKDESDDYDKDEADEQEVALVGEDFKQEPVESEEFKVTC